MKRFILHLTTLATVFAVMSCSSSKSKADTAADSARQADSIGVLMRAAEAMEAAVAEEAAAAAWVDSMRQDSIQKAQKVQNAMPVPKMFKDANGYLIKPDKLKSKLASQGYQKNGANTYVLNPNGNPSYTVRLKYEYMEGEEGEFGLDTYEIYITFPEKAQAAKFVQNWGSTVYGTNVTQQGATVELSIPEM